MISRYVSRMLKFLKLKVLLWPCMTRFVDALLLKNVLNCVLSFSALVRYRELVFYLDVCSLFVFILLYFCTFYSLRVIPVPESMSLSYLCLKSAA